MAVKNHCNSLREHCNFPDHGKARPNIEVNDLLDETNKYSYDREFSKAFLFCLWHCLWPTSYLLQFCFSKSGPHSNIEIITISIFPPIHSEHAYFTFIHYHFSTPCIYLFVISWTSWLINAFYWLLRISRLCYAAYLLMDACDAHISIKQMTPYLKLLVRYKLLDWEDGMEVSVNFNN